VNDCTNKVKDTLAVYLKADARILGGTREHSSRIQYGTTP